MPSTARTRTLAAAQQRVWELIADPDHMHRWWPGVKRMEAVDSDRFTQVLTTRKGRPVRMDFVVVASDPPWRRAWEQEVIGTPFERVLDEAVTEIVLEPVDGGTEVTITLRQKLRGYSRTGGFMLRRATRKKLDEALEGLAQVCA
jgi:carbon monoxide dehydrogenase subunit G